MKQHAIDNSDAALDLARERYRSAASPIEREQARRDIDAIAIYRDAWRKVRAAALAGDPWVLEQLRELAAELNEPALRRLSGCS